MIEYRPRNLAEKIVFIGSLLLSLSVGLLFPLVTDEAYYLDWARSYEWPSLGFFDHPPLVSWIGGAARFLDHPLGARFFVWILSLITALYCWKIAKRLMPNRALTVVAVTTSSIAGIASAFLLTPDTGLALAWVVAIHEALIALTENPKRWLSAGLATGIGILSKYTMLLIGPIFLFALLKESRRQLRTIWPYAGGAVCLLVILPHLWWQSHNGWITFKFQFRHGFSISQESDSKSILPRAYDADKDSTAVQARNRLLLAMQQVAGFDDSIRKPKPEKSRLEKAWQYTGDYIGGVAALWGFYSLTAIISIINRRRHGNHRKLDNKPAGFSLITIAALFPLIFFGLLSPFTKIEANWPAMHMSALAIWVVWRTPPSSRTLYTVFAGHILVFLSLLVILMNPTLLKATRDNRILLESRGYQSLGFWLVKNTVSGPIAVDSYQLKSSIRLYAPEIEVVQWPGFTRDSEYTRGRPEDQDLERKFLSLPQFTVIATSSSPKMIPGYEVSSYGGIRVCPDGSLSVFDELNPVLTCKKGLREWWVVNYLRQKP